MGARAFRCTADSVGDTAAVDETRSAYVEAAMTPDLAALVAELRAKAERAEQSRLRGKGWHELDSIYPQQLLRLCDALESAHARAERLESNNDRLRETLQAARSRLDGNGLLPDLVGAIDRALKETR